jgi:hypothetical protein
MATQGLVTVRRKGKVALKIVAGCNGMQAAMLARKLRAKKEVPTLKEAYDLAVSTKFGSGECLVVINETGELYKGDEEVGPLYRETFDQPRFNPRWKQGTADHIILVDL